LSKPEVPSTMQQSTNPLIAGVWILGSGDHVHALHCLHTLTAFSEVTVLWLIDKVFGDEQFPSQALSNELLIVTLAVQRSFMRHATRVAIAYTNDQLERAQRLHSDEWRRISRDLHDRAAHSMVVALQSLELYEMGKGQDPQKAKADLQRVKISIQEAIDLIKNVSTELRRSSTETGLELSLKELVRNCVPQEIESWVSVRGNDSLITPLVREELFLILGEAIRNAAAHSRASMIIVDVTVAENSIKATIEDDGQGFELGKEGTHPSGMGLTCMQERVELLGGTLSVASKPGNGTRIETFLNFAPRTQG
jgi:signal transduction histidine kinase